MIGDWTGDRWAKNWETYGIEPHPPVDVKTKEEQETAAKEFQEKLTAKEEKFKKKSEDDSKEFKLDKKEESIQK